MARAEDIAVALLAAGRSTRFGAADKLAAPLGGRPLVQWAAQAGLTVPARHHLLVAGPDAAFEVDGYERMTNAAPDQGMASSLKIAAQAAEQAGVAGLLILLADMPLIDAAHLARIVSAFVHDGSRPVFSTAPDTAPQPPALLPASLFAALQAIDGDKGARGFAAGASLVASDAERLLDVDTPDDLERARSLIAPT